MSRKASVTIEFKVFTLFVVSSVASSYILMLNWESSLRFRIAKKNAKHSAAKVWPFFSFAFVLVSYMLTPAPLLFRLQDVKASALKASCI
jgi:hypothetical protein